MTSIKTFKLKTYAQKKIMLSITLLIVEQEKILY